MRKLDFTRSEVIWPVERTAASLRVMWPKEKKWNKWKETKWRPWHFHAIKCFLVCYYLQRHSNQFVVILPQAPPDYSMHKPPFFGFFCLVCLMLKRRLFHFFFVDRKILKHLEKKGRLKLCTHPSCLNEVFDTNKVSLKLDDLLKVLLQNRNSTTM